MKTWKIALGAALFSLVSSVFAAVDLNTADVKTLEKLPGIGPAKAQAIVDHRTKVGAFKNIEELKKVDGIGTKTFEALKNEITVGK
jgi:competence protein ComEA